MAKQTAQAIAEWAEQKSRPAPTPAYRRLTQQQLVAMLAMHKLGKTQVEIAESLGCDQKTVSRWLASFTDTTEHATAYLRGSALRMAENIVKRGQARDHIQALNGLGVLQTTESRQLNVFINGLTLHGTGKGEVAEGQVLSPPQLESGSESE